MSIETSPDRLQVFVYGSLKRGSENHQRYCAGYRVVHEAMVLGKLYLQPSGYPMLVIPPGKILVTGTPEASEDLAEQVRLAVRSSELSDSLADTGVHLDGDWEWIEGEIFSFDDGRERLALLDRLEDFRPDQHCLYHRVVAQARHKERESVRMPVWMYVAPEGCLPPGSTRIGTSWS